MTERLHDMTPHVMFDVISVFSKNIIQKTSNFNYSVRFTVFNTIFNNISVISWRLVLLIEKTRILKDNHRPAASHWQTVSHNVVSSTPRLNGIRTRNVSSDSHCLHSSLLIQLPYDHNHDGSILIILLLRQYKILCGNLQEMVFLNLLSCRLWKQAWLKCSLASWETHGWIHSDHFPHYPLVNSCENHYFWIVRKWYVCNSVNDNIIMSLKHLILDGLNRLWQI